jgi:hypothetical protein
MGQSAQLNIWGERTRVRRGGILPIERALAI